MYIMMMELKRWELHITKYFGVNFYFNFKKEGEMFWAKQFNELTLSEIQREKNYTRAT